MVEVLLHKIYITKNITLETLLFILSNVIIFVLYNLYYIDQIDNLGIRVLRTSKCVSPPRMKDPVSHDKGPGPQRKRPLFTVLTRLRIISRSI
jgi:hypothetical protein